MKLSEDEQRYLNCLAEEMTFEEMAVELGWTVEEVRDFGMKFFDRAFEERKQTMGSWFTGDEERDARRV